MITMVTSFCLVDAEKNFFLDLNWPESNIRSRIDDRQANLLMCHSMENYIQNNYQPLLLFCLNSAKRIA